MNKITNKLYEKIFQHNEFNEINLLIIIFFYVQQFYNLGFFSFDLLFISFPMHVGI